MAVASVPRRLSLLLSIWLLVTALTHFGAQFFRPFNQAERVVKDVIAGVFKKDTITSRPVIVVRITEESLARLPYRSPINRGFIADLIEQLLAQDVAMVGIDIVFNRQTDPASDQRLRQVLNAHRSRVVMALAGEDLGLTAEQLDYQTRFTEGLIGGNSALPLVDNVVRYYFSGRVEKPSFASQLYLSTQGEWHRLAVDQESKFELDFPAPIDGSLVFPQIAVDHIESLPAGWLRDKIVIVGGDMPDQDRHRTPYSVFGGDLENLSGVFIHAVALEQMLEARNVPNLPPALTLLAVMLLAGAGVALASPRFNLFSRLGLASLILTAYLILVALLYQETGRMLPPLSAPAAMLVALLCASLYAVRRERAERAALEDSFGHYVSPQIVERLASSSQNASLSRGLRDMSFVFTDLQGFTSLSESIRPESLVAILQGYFDGLVNIALDHDATIDKFVGDAIHLFFNAPVDQPDHVQRALRCALDLDTFSEQFRAEQNEHGLSIGTTRIGVHTGEAFIDNVGGQRLFSYTAHGDVVNTAARLEAANKPLGTRLCVTSEVMRCNPDIAARPIGTLFLRGKTEGVDCFDPTSVDTDLLQSYNDAFPLLDGDRTLALARFTELSERWPSDALVRYHLGRLSQGDFTTHIRIG